MGYRSSLLTRWTRRDRLAIVVVAITIAFLTGTTLLILSAGEQTTTIAANFTSPAHVTHYESLATAESALSPGAVILPYALVSESTGTSNYVITPPENTSLNLTTTEVRFGSTSDVTQGGLSTTEKVKLKGSEGTQTFQVSPGTTPLIPDEWYVAPQETTASLGIDGAFVISPTTGQDSPASQVTPILSALTFFVLGTRQALGTLSITAVGAGLLVGITIFSVTRMTVQDRLRTIQTIRATGGRSSQVIGLYSLRAMLITLVGSALGYAIGVILPSATINFAVFTGLPTSLSVSVTPEAVRVLIPLLLGLTLIGALSGVIAAWPAATKPPGQITSRTEQTTPAGGETKSGEGTTPFFGIFPKLLDFRAVVPTTAILSAFVLFSILIFAMGGVITPLATAEEATITEPDKPHPFASQVPENYADALRSQGIAASPEILLLEVVEGEPFLARGVNYSAYNTLTPTKITQGRSPSGPGEAVIGEDLAQTLDVNPGTSITLGGSTESAITRVSIVGVYVASGPFDDQILVSLTDARHLSGFPPNRVQFVRSEGLPDVSDNESGVGLIDIDAPKQTRSNSTINVEVTLRNDGLTVERKEFAVSLGEDERQLSIRVPPQSEVSENVKLSVGLPGTYDLSAGNISTNVRVVDEHSFEIQPFPTSAPPNTEPLLRVKNADGSPASGVVIQVDNHTLETNAKGERRIPVERTGTYDIHLRNGSHTRSIELEVSEEAARSPLGSVEIRPNSPSVLTQPNALVDLYNPWNTRIGKQITLQTPQDTIQRNASLAPGTEQTFSYSLARLPPDTYTVTVFADGESLTTATYTVTGDERIATTLARSGRVQETGLSRAIETAFGNLNILLGVILVLGSLMTIGGTTASFAKEVHARRQTIGIYRSTGASPLKLYRLVVTDTLKIGVVAIILASIIATGILAILDKLGYLTVFGVRLSPIPDPLLMAGIIAAGILLTVLGSVLAMTNLVWMQPARLIAGKMNVVRGGREGKDE